MKLTIVKIDNAVIVDDIGLSVNLSPFGLPATFWALQWSENSGEIEYTDKPNESINSLEPYQAIIDEHTRLKNEAVNPPPPTEAETYAGLLSERTSKITSSDWIIKRHRDEKDLGKNPTLTEAEFIEALQWQDDLRELPQKYPTSDVWVWPVAPNVIIKMD